MEKNNIYAEAQRISIVVSKTIRNEYITSDEQVALDSWIENDPRNAATYQQLISEKNSEKSLLEFILACEQSDNRLMNEFRRRNKTVRRFRTVSLISGIAAAVVIIVAILIPRNYDVDAPNLIAQSSDTVIYLINSKGEKMQIDNSKVFDVCNEVADNGTKDVSNSQINTIIVPLRKNIKVILGDGTSVWLNSSSKLSFPVQFAKNNREVTLVGEGYFEVAKDANRPFFVKTANLTTKVLGTKFFVTAYKDDTESRVSLMEGSVRVKMASSDVLLSAGQGVLCDSKSGAAQTFLVDQDKIESIFSDKFLFKNESLEDIAKALQRWYGVEIVFEDDSMRNILFYIKTNRYDNIVEFMSLLKETNNVNYRVEKDKLIIY